MYKIKIVFCLFCQIFFLTAATAQKSERAEQVYQNLGYKEAIKLYETKDNLSLEDMGRIANSYRLNNDTENTALWYRQVISREEKPIYCLYLAQALQSNGDNESAKKYFLRYDELIGGKTNDRRGAFLAAAIDRMNDWGNEEEVILKSTAAINSDRLEFSPAFYKNGIVFVSSRKLSDNKKYKWTDDHFMNLFYAPTNQAGMLDTAQAFSASLNSQYHEGPVVFDKSFNRIFFTRNDHLNGKRKMDKKGVMKLGIFTAIRDGEDWTTPKPLHFNTSEYEECHPSLSADGQQLFFASNRPEGEGGMDLYISTFKGGKWSAPINLGPDINTPGNEVFPFIHDDGTLYFASDGWGGLGGLDIFHSRKDKIDQWMTAENIGQPYNSRKDDFGFILNVLGTEGYLTSSREGGQGKDDIYKFTRSAKAMIQPKVRIIAFDKESNEIIPGATCYKHEKREYMTANSDKNFISNAPDTDSGKKANILETIYITDEKGEHELTIEKGKEYTFVIEKEGYWPIEKKMRISKDDDTMLHLLNMSLEKKECMALNGKVICTADNRKIEGAAISLINLCTDEKYEQLSDAEGNFEFNCIEFDCDYILNGSKAHFMAGSTTFATFKRATDSGKPHSKNLYLQPQIESRFNSTNKNAEDTAMNSEAYSGEGSQLGQSYNENHNTNASFPESSSTAVSSSDEAPITNAQTTGSSNAAPITNTKNLADLAEVIKTESIRVGEVYELKDVYYDFDRYNIKYEASVELDKVVEMMKEHPGLELELSSHTDSRGKANYNQWLSRKRATFAVKYITDQGIHPRRIVARGYGENALKFLCDEEVDCGENFHQLNRRTEIRIIKVE